MQGCGSHDDAAVNYLQVAAEQPQAVADGTVVLRISFTHVPGSTRWNHL